MSMEFLVEGNGKIYEISELITSVSFTDKLNDGCSKLEFSYLDDALVVTNGSVIRFKYNETEVFYGHVFKVKQAKNKEISVTAYDQLRYCKAKDTIVVRNDTITSLVKKMCNYFGLRSGVLKETGYPLATNVRDDKTWLDILYSAIDETLTNKGDWHALRDEFGSISLRDLVDLQLNLVLGDESLCYNYEYEKSIDENFYNQIKLARDNETTGKREVYIAKNGASISTYGLLQYFEVLDKKTNDSQAKAKADLLLSLYNREAETVSLDCLGDMQVRAGSSFFGRVEDINLNKRLLVRSVTHAFLPTHTMSLEVSM